MDFGGREIPSRKGPGSTCLARLSWPLPGREASPSKELAAEVHNML